MAATVADMADYKMRQLAQEEDLLIVVSTYGEGDPPQPATGFFEFVEGRKAPRLENLRFAVLALGDSTYEYFCEAGKRLDRRLEELGAKRLLERVDCDIDYDDAAAAWTTAVVEHLASEAAATPVSVAAATGETVPATVHDKRNPFPAAIIENIAIVGRGSSKETRHVEFSLAGSGLTYQPGDALNVQQLQDAENRSVQYARNPDGSVDYNSVPLRGDQYDPCLLYTSPSPRDRTRSRMPSSA